jgi:hypothetical protein
VPECVTLVRRNSGCYTRGHLAVVAEKPLAHLGRNFNLPAPTLAASPHTLHFTRLTVPSGVWAAARCDSHVPLQAHAGAVFEIREPIPEAAEDYLYVFNNVTVGMRDCTGRCMNSVPSHSYAMEGGQYHTSYHVHVPSS